MIEIDLFTNHRWQMALGQRAALEGLLTQLRPQVAVEIGTAEGGSLACVARNSNEVHAFDLEFNLDRGSHRNVHFHQGDSHILLPRVLAELTEARKHVDFALVDGDHSAAGAREDLETLLASDAVRKAVIVMHDTMNEDVRRGIEGVMYEQYPKVVYTDLNFVLGYQDPGPLDEMWGGLGLVVVDQSQTNYRVFDDSIIRRGRLPARARFSSFAWRAATPLRAARRELRRYGERMLRQRSLGASARTENGSQVGGET